MLVHESTQPIAAVLVVLILHSVLCTYDMNLQQLQYVSDHLTLEECREVSSALRQTTLKLDKSKVNGTAEPDVPCLNLLLYWDRHGGMDRSYNDLSTRLRELGHEELAEQLAEDVITDQIDAYHRSMHDEALDEAAKQDSQLVEEAPKASDKKEEEEPEHKKLEVWHYVAISVGIVAFILLIVFCTRNTKRCKRLRGMTQAHLLGTPSEHHKPVELEDDPLPEDMTEQDLDLIRALMNPRKVRKGNRIHREVVYGDIRLDFDHLGMGEPDDKDARQFVSYLSKL